ncbi:hypothetical protein VW23_014655 [Devosia insulae DS-56]|uniref:ATP-dependent Clp protease proteolytic subunit n=2 Tax=Devosia insulae TaxID=408174 RepID=A0A1E5XT71_9HYPH|nr:hypothetical protein VW23_014655 [Devosia insulae DS-56]
MAFGAGHVSGAGAAEYSYRTNERDEVVMRLSGRITSMDGAIFLAEVREHEPRIIELEGPGGDMLSAVRIGVIIHERYLRTHAVGTCLSACAYIWISGLKMIADEGVEISNHLPVAIQGASVGRPDDKTIAIFGWYLGKLNISVEMMSAFLDAAMGPGVDGNGYFDMLAFASYWNAPIEMRVPAPTYAAIE